MARVAKDPSVKARRIEGLRKSPTLMPAALLDELFSKRVGLLPASSAGTALHIPTPALTSIADAGLLSCEVDPLCLPAGQYFSRDSIDELTAKLVSKLRLGSIPDGALSLVDAAFLLGSPDNNPWANLLTAVIEGRLPVWQRKVVGLTNRVMLASLDEAREVVQTEPWSLRDESSTLTNLDVMLLLGAGNATNAVTLIRNEQLPRKPCLRHVQMFSAKYMLTQELGRELAARRVCTNLRAVASTLILEGVLPVARLTHKSASLLLWDRATAKNILHDRFPHPEPSRQ
jgi:hypothetical protein